MQKMDFGSSILKRRAVAQRKDNVETKVHLASKEAVVAFQTG
jgi:hypothetical protein